MKSLQEQLNDLKVYKEKQINPEVKKVEQIVTKSSATYMKDIGKEYIANVNTPFLN